MGKNQSKHEDLIIAQTASGDAQANQNHQLTTSDILLITIAAAIVLGVIVYIIKKWQQNFMRAMRHEISLANIKTTVV